MSAQNFHIAHYCVIENQRISVDGKEVFSTTDMPFADFIKTAFKSLEIDYGKFYKMDNLSKLAFVGAEHIFQLCDSTENTALLFSNKSGSLDSDVKHQESIQQADGYFPSPAVFVYTLANICAGEVSIRHGLQSENTFLVSEQFDVDTVYSYTGYLLSSGKAKQVLCAWVEIFEEKYTAVLYLAGTEGNQPHTKDFIRQLF